MSGIEERGLPDNTHQEVLIDEIVRLTGNGTSGQYPKSIRRIAVYNAEHHFTMVLQQHETLGWNHLRPLQGKVGH